MVTRGPETPVVDLPVALTRFVGRERELDELQRLIRGTRLLTLTGAGGSGKTRLAQELTARIATGQELVAWVDLAPLVDASLLVAQVAAAVKTGERPGMATLEATIAAIGDRPSLLVLDNCEHLVDAAAGLAERLLSRCPRLVVLATSREALGVQGETAWLVPSLAAAEAIQLFVERAQQVVPGFLLTAENAAAVHDICGRLDGIPLAIELAAARVRVLSPEQIAERLSDALRLLNAGSRTALPRHRTIRGTLDWSFALLSPLEQRLLERLAVFAGTFSMEAAEAICPDDDLAVEDILDGVSTLVDKSLVVLDTTDHEARYRLLDTVRQYGEERLRAAGQWEPLRARHAEYFIAGAEHAAPFVFAGAADPVWFTRLSHNASNLRAAADWAAERPERTEPALRLGWALHWFWYARGAFEEGRHRLTAALDQPVAVDPVIRAKASVALGHIGIWQGWRSGVRPLMEAAVDPLRAANDPELVAYAINGIGAGLVFEGDPRAARPYLDQALALIEHRPPQVIHSLVHYWRAWAARERGEFELARISLTEASRIGRLIGHRPARAHPLALLGQFDVAAGRPAAALGYFAESLPILADLGDVWGIGRALQGVGSAALMLGDPGSAALLIAAAEAIRKRNATPLSTTELDDHQRSLGRIRDALGADFEARWREGLALPIDQAVDLALTVARRAAPPPPSAPAQAAPARADGSVPAGSTAAVGSATAPAPEPPLRVRALGPLQVFRHGVAIEPAAWGSARPRELLVFLLCHPRGVSREQVGAALWPDASASQVRNSFHVTLHRLRKALGEGEWVQVNQDRYGIDPAIVAFDVTTFERDLESAGDPAHDGPAAAERLRAALAQVGGDFLAGEPAGDWRRAIAERLERRYLDGYLTLARWEADQGRPDRAAEACRRIIARQPLHEEAWRRLMAAQAAAGDLEQARRSYRQLTDLLEAETGSRPDQVTTELYERIGGG